METLQEMKCLEVGDILEYSWGYDQTNIDFFKVVRRSESSVWLIALGVSRTYTGAMQGVVTPDLKNEIGEVFRRKIKKAIDWQGRDGDFEYVSIRDYGWCGFWDGQPAHFTEWA